MNSDSKENLFWYHLARRLIIVVAVFAMLLSVLMIANFIQTRSIDPLNSQALNQLMLQLQKEPDNKALQEQIRALDLLARRAYFTHQWQLHTGSLLLFGSVLLLLVLLKYLSTFRAKFQHLLNDQQPSESWEARILARKYIIATGLGIFFLAFLSGIFSESELQDSNQDDPSATLFASVEELQNNWPGFRGPGGNGIVYQSGFPTEWDMASGENILWKIQIPKSGYNSPVVWNKKIFLSGADKESQEVYCIDAETGQILWTVELNTIEGTPAKKPKVTKDTGYAASTMTTNGTYVYVIFATGDVACLDFDGTVIWSKNLGVPDNHYGHSSSLITWKNLLLIQYDHSESKQLIALNAASGADVYRKTRDVQITWASPILVDTGERMELILTSTPFVISYNPQNGQELWRVDCMSGEVGSSPAYADGMVFAGNEFAILAGINLENPVKIAWEYEDDLPEVSSPVATPELLFVATSFGAVSCLDTKTGELYWMHEFDRGFYSSPILADGRIYLIDMTGMMHIFKADKEFSLIGESDLGEGAVTIPAFKDGRIYIRGNDHLICIAEINA